MYEARSRVERCRQPLSRAPPWHSLRGVPSPLSAGSSRDFEGLPLQRAPRHGDLHRCASTQRVWHTPCRELIHASRPTVAEHCHRKTVTAVRRIRKRLPPHPPLLPQTRLTPALCASIADGRRVRVRRLPSNRTAVSPKSVAPHRRVRLSSPPRRSAGCVVKIACSMALVAKAKGPSPQEWGAVGPPHTCTSPPVSPGP